VLPKPDVIYDKEFHFLDETLNQKHQRKIEKTEVQKVPEIAEESNLNMPIQLNNQKDFSHDRSLSKIRKPDPKPNQPQQSSIFSEKFIEATKNDEVIKPLRGIPIEEPASSRFQAKVPTE
jgi:hypothetical protein